MVKFCAAWGLLGLVGCGATDGLVEEPGDSERRRAAIAEIVGEELVHRVTSRGDRRVEPVYGLLLANGNRVEWYEVLDGLPIAVESGAQPSTLTRPMKVDAGSAGELFSALLPTAPLPVELAELDARQLELSPAYRALADAEPRFTSVRLPRLAPTEERSSASIRDQTSPPSGCLERSWCGRAGLDWAEAQHELAGDAALARDDNFWVDATTCVSAGSVTHRVQYRSWWTPTAWFSRELGEGVWLSAWTVSKSAAFSVHAQLESFAGGGVASQCLTGLRPISDP
jgi:hypothetical protein